MQIIEEFTVTCCKDFDRQVASTRHQALGLLLYHIRAHHPKWFDKINKHARTMAASALNGLCYGDNGESEGSDWHKAPEAFHEAWRISALEDVLKGNFKCT